MRLQKFCPKCGKTTENLYDNLCKDCFLQKINLKDLPEKITVRQCKICGKFFGNERGELSLENAINQILSRVLRENVIQSATSRIIKNKVYRGRIVESGGLKKTM